MRRTRVGWRSIAAAVIALSAVFVALFAGQVSPTAPVTLRDLYDLLVTSEGENRLALISARLDGMDAEIQAISARVDGLSSQEKARAEQISRELQTQNWTITDLKYGLDAMKRQLDQIESKIDSLP